MGGLNHHNNNSIFQRNSLISLFWVLLILLGIMMSSCGRTLELPEAPTTTSTPIEHSDETKKPGPTVPISPVTGLAGFSPSTSRSVAGALEKDPAAGGDQPGYNGLNASSFPLLGDILSPGIFDPAASGLTLAFEKGGFWVFNNRLIPSNGILSLGNLSYSLPDIYLAGVLDVSAPNGNSGSITVPPTTAGFFVRHPNNRQDNTLMVGELFQDRGITHARIVGKNSAGTETVYSDTLVPLPGGILEFMAYKNSLLLYYNGFLVGAHTNGEIPNLSYFGFRALNGQFVSFAASDLDKVRDKSPLIFYQDNFQRPNGPLNRPMGPLMPSQWQIHESSSTPYVFNGRVFSLQNTAIATLNQVQLSDVDVRINYRLSPANSNTAILFRQTGEGSANTYQSRIWYDSNKIFYVSLLHSDGSAVERELVKTQLPLAQWEGALRVVAQGSEIRIYVNGRLYISYQVRAEDQFPAMGKTGFSVTNSEIYEYSIRSSY